MGYYENDYDNGSYRRGDIEAGGGYYYRSYTYGNPGTGYYHTDTFTQTLYGDTVYRHDVSVKQNAYYQERLYQNQYAEGIHDPYYGNGSYYNIYTDGARVQTYVNLQNYAAGWTETTQTYGYGGPYGEYLSGYSTYDGPVKGFEGSYYSTYIPSYDGYTPLR